MGVALPENIFTKRGHQGHSRACTCGVAFIVVRNSFDTRLLTSTSQGCSLITVICIKPTHCIHSTQLSRQKAAMPSAQQSNRAITTLAALQHVRVWALTVSSTSATKRHWYITCVRGVTCQPLCTVHCRQAKLGCQSVTLYAGVSWQCQQ